MGVFLLKRKIAERKQKLSDVMGESGLTGVTFWSWKWPDLSWPIRECLGNLFWLLSHLSHEEWALIWALGVFRKGGWASKEWFLTIIYFTKGVFYYGLGASTVNLCSDGNCHEGQFIFPCSPLESPSLPFIFLVFCDHFLVFLIVGLSSAQAADELGSGGQEGSQGLECNAWGASRAVWWNPMEGHKQEHSHRHSHAPVVYKEASPALYMPHTQYIVTSHHTGSLSGSCVLPGLSRWSPFSIIDSQ